VSTPELVAAFYDRIWNRSDLAAIPELLAPDLAFRGSLGAELRGHAAFEAYLRSVRGALAGYRCEILACVAEGDQAFARVRFSGTHVAPFRGFAPTGKPVAWQGAAWFRFEGRLIAEIWVLGDLAGLDAVLDANRAT
jgi:predicted ester cyclase